MEKFYITTSIAYANASPHIGFALESIQADVIARHNKQTGKDVYFLTGMDEHGSKIQRTAEAAGKNTQEFVDVVGEEFKKLKEALNLSWTDFIRTTDKERHWPAVAEVWKKLEENGDIYKQAYEGLYCVGCESFKAEKDLIDGKCPDHNVVPEIVREENYFFSLSKYADAVKEKIEKDEIKIYPETRKNEILALFREGIKDISISRPKEKLSWGIPVPDDEGQVIYVWIDALTNYISAIGYGQDEKKFKKYWPADVHCIGKDILKFHALIWPAMLLAIGEKAPKALFVHGYITSGGQKMSKSLGNVVSPFELSEKYGADALRYYLLSEISTFEDGDFSYDKFEKRYNGDLANGIGNFAARVLTLASKAPFEIKEEDFEKAGKFELWGNNAQEMDIRKDFTALEAYKNKMSEYKLSEALNVAMLFSKLADGWVNTFKPWEDAEKKKNELVYLLYFLRETTKMLEAFLPETSEKILSCIKSENGVFYFVKPEALFPRIEQVKK